MDSQYSEENSMESHTEDDSSITTEERDENSSEEEQIKAASQLKTVLKRNSIPGLH